MNGISCKIEIPAQIRRGDSCPLTFTLENGGTYQAHILTWSTPLEGILGRIFRVTRDGIECQYRGPLVKRGAPTAEDYVTLQPGESISATVDLKLAYALNETGIYEIAYISGLKDVAFEAEPFPREDVRPAKLDCGVVKFKIVD